MRNHTVTLEETLIGWEVEAVQDRLQQLAQRLEKLELKQQGRFAQLFGRLNFYRSATFSTGLVIAVGLMAIAVNPGLSQRLPREPIQTETHLNNPVPPVPVSGSVATPAVPRPDQVTIQPTPEAMTTASQSAASRAATCQERGVYQAVLAKEASRYQQSIKDMEKTLKSLLPPAEYEAALKAEHNQHAANQQVIANRYDC